MYIIAIAWLYVTVLMAATEKTITSGVLNLYFTGYCHALYYCGYSV